MKWAAALQWALLAALSCAAYAQDPPASAAKAPTRAAFDLEIDAPDEIKGLLGRHLELLRYRELTDLSDGELARLLNAAEKNTRELIATLGYFSPEIRIQSATAGATTARQVSLHVHPGEATTVSEVQIKFSGPIATDAASLAQRQLIQERWSLRPGRRFTQDAWDTAKRQALQQLTTLRYATGRIEASLADIDPVTRKARLAVTLDSGPAYRLGALAVSGTRHYGAELVRRLARLDPGAEYDLAQLVQAQQRLSDSGYFDSAIVSLDASAEASAAPVRVQVREAPLQKLVLGVGASTDSGARLSAQHTHHKAPGIGWRAVSNLLLDRDTQSIGSELTAPPDDDNWRWVTSALLQRQQSGSFDLSSQRLRAGRSQTDWRIDRNYYLQYDRAQTVTPDASTKTVVDSLSANYAFTLRNFDSMPYPSRGWGLGAEVGGGSTLGGQQYDPYGRVLLRWLGYYPLGGSADPSGAGSRGGRLALRAQVGAVIAKDGVVLPSTQLFLAGGDNSVRGYSHNAIGVALASGQTTVGRYLTTGSLEWQRPITFDGRPTDWESTLFVDAGAVANQVSDLRLQVGVGAGVRLKSPVGPLQIDVAYGVDVKRLRLHLSVGFVF